MMQLQEMFLKWYPSQLPHVHLVTTCATVMYIDLLKYVDWHFCASNRDVFRLL